MASLSLFWKPVRRVDSQLKVARMLGSVSRSHSDKHHRPMLTSRRPIYKVEA
jgi:hypothetical protein